MSAIKDLNLIRLCNNNTPIGAATDFFNTIGHEAYSRCAPLNARCPFRRYVRGALGRRPALDAQ